MVSKFLLCKSRDYYEAVSYTHLDVYKRQVVGTVETKYKTPIKSLITPALIFTVKQIVINNTVSYNKSNKNCSHAINSPLILNIIVLQLFRSIIKRNTSLIIPLKRTQ